MPFPLVHFPFAQIDQFNFQCPPNKPLVLHHDAKRLEEADVIDKLDLEQIRLRIIEKHEFPCQLANEIIAE